MSCGHCQSWLLPKTEKFSTCYFPYLNPILILLFQVALAETAAAEDFLKKNFTGLLKFSVRCSVIFRKCFADFIRTFLFVQKYCEKWIAWLKLFIFACKYNFESL